MKKLVALAVAGAFIAPVYAADISISGEMEFTYTSTNSVGSTASTNILSTADSRVNVTAVEDVNGVKFTAVVRMDQDAANNTAGDASTLTMAFPNGFRLGLGEQSGALDSVGDYSDISPVLGGNFSSADGSDHGVLVVLPSFAGVTAYVSHSPKDGTAIGTTAAKDSYSLKYAFPNGEVYYGVEDTGGTAPTSLSAYGVKYSVSGFLVAYETGTLSRPSSVDDIKYTGAALSYKMGDVVLGFEMNKAQTEGSTPSTDNTVMFAEYNLGGSVDLFVANESSSVATTADRIAVGVEYAF